MSIATGLPFLGLHTQPGRVLYFDEENSQIDLEAYLRWMWNGMGKPDLNTLSENLHIEHFSLTEHPLSRWSFMAQKAAQHKPILVVIDTATPAFDIRDENDNAEATRVIGQLRRVRAATGDGRTSMLIIKHAKFTHDASERRTMRGAKTWHGAVDGVLFHVGLVGRPRKHGLRPSQIEPDKIRAYGLKETLRIHPEWLEVRASLRLSRLA